MALFQGNNKYDALNEINAQIHIFLQTLIDLSVSIISVNTSMICKQNNYYMK